MDRSRALIDLGHEQPIFSGPKRLEAFDRRHLSIRWLIGVALTGLSGMALIGSALYLGFDQQSNFAQSPEIAAAARRDAGGEEGINPGKGDRLVRPVDIVAARQTYKTPTTIRIGDKEVVKLRAFTHVATMLTVTPTSFASAVPPFNPLKLASGSSEQPEAPPDPGPLQDDAEVAFSTHDLGPGDAAAIAGDLSTSEAQAQVDELIRASASPKTLPLPAQMLLMKTSQAGLDPLGGLSYATTGGVNPNAPFGSIEVKMVPENVTNALKASSLDEAPADRLIQLRHGEKFEDVLRANGASAEAIAAIVAAFGAKRGETPASEGQKIILHFDEPPAPRAPRAIARVSVYADEQLRAAVAANDSGAYAPLATQAAAPARKATGNPDDETGISLYQSLYETALKQGLPQPIIQEMIKAFSNDVDFQRPVTPSDSIETFYSEPDDIDSKPELLFATVIARDQAFRYYRFQTPDDGLVDYYDENGRSTRKFLIRKPIASGELRSGFGMRIHPIMHYARMHTGVDWSNAIGTPILAAGNGTIIKAEFTSGYGRRVEIQHLNGYVTTYSHMSGFGPGIVAGVHVNQGQVIGYLGQSGLATGPHLHYEVIINGNFVDPMAIKLARTREMDRKMLTAFQRERDRISQLIAQAPNSIPAAAATISAKAN
jgi:murein DD-endopeptidase MepM/ murein hydrolase activator NlpD